MSHAIVTVYYKPGDTFACWHYHYTVIDMVIIVLKKRVNNEWMKVMSFEDRDDSYISRYRRYQVINKFCISA